MKFEYLRDGMQVRLKPLETFGWTVPDMYPMGGEVVTINKVCHCRAVYGPSSITFEASDMHSDRRWSFIGDSIAEILYPMFDMLEKGDRIRLAKEPPTGFAVANSAAGLLGNIVKVHGLTHGRDGAEVVITDDDPARPICRRCWRLQYVESLVLDDRFLRGGFDELPELTASALDMLF